MSDAIKKLHDYLAMSPSVVYPEDVLAYLPAIEDENAKLREYITRLEQANIALDSDNCDLRNDMKDMQFFIAENAKLRELVVRMYKSIRWSDMTSDSMFSVAHSYEKDMRKLGIEVPDAG